MKLALCLTGQPRDIKNSLKNIKNSWDKNQDVDFFFHGWRGENNVPFRLDTPSDVYTDDLFDYAIDILNPVDHIIEDQIEFNKEYNDSVHWRCYHPVFNTKPYQNIQSQFYSNMMCNKIKSNAEKKGNFKYDAVLKCRFDYLFGREYDISKYDLSCMNVKSDCKHTEYAIGDHTALSNSDNMNVYADLYNNLDKYYEMGVEFNPEVILGYHIHYNNIPVAKTMGGMEESIVSTTKERSMMYGG